MPHNRRNLKRQTGSSKRARSVGITYKTCNTFNNHQELKEYLIQVEKNVWSR